MAKGKVNIGRSGMWRPTVNPFLENLAGQLKEKSENSVTVDIEGVRILVTPLEQELVLSLLDDDIPPPSRKRNLVRDGIGLRIKLLSGLNRMAQVSAEERDELINTIKEDVDLGCQLMHEITLEMRSMSSPEEIAGAQEFSSYRQQLSRVVSEAERRTEGREGVAENTAVFDDPAPAKSEAETTPSAAEGSPKRKGRCLGWIALTLVVVAAALVAAGLYLT